FRWVVRILCPPAAPSGPAQGLCPQSLQAFRHPIDRWVCPSIDRPRRLGTIPPGECPPTHQATIHSWPKRNAVPFFWSASRQPPFVSFYASLLQRHAPRTNSCAPPGVGKTVAIAIQVFSSQGKSFRPGANIVPRP